MLRSSIVSAFKGTRHFSASAARNSFARVQILGRIGQDLEPLESAQGNKYLKYSVAVQQKRDGPVSWFNILTFNENQVAFMTQYVRKGALVLIDANVKQETYEREDGSRGSNISFFQQRIDLLNNPKAEEVE